MPVHSNMVDVEIYTSPLCGYCHAAKKLLQQKGVKFREYDVLFDKTRKLEMLDRSDGKHTVPQIFVDSTSIGGYDQLVLLERKQVLDSMLTRDQDN